jgi:hypothetical protein
MIAAFATPTDLAVRMKRTFTADEQSWVETLLEDAAAFMRGVMRNQVYPARQSTYLAYPVGGWVRLPQSHIVSVDAVVAKLTGVPVEWEQEQDSIHVHCDEGPVTVTFTYGLTVPPDDLVNINCALVSQQMLTVESGLGLNAGGISSASIDDYKIAFADGGKGSGLSMTDATRKYLEDTYGTTGWFVATNR